MNKLINVFKDLGPGPLVAAAFIGPGTVTVCAKAGVNFSYALLWALLLSVFICILFQGMAARLGVVSQKGLAQVMRESIANPILKYFVLAVSIAAIIVGNAAYEGGNITGGSMGLTSVFGTLTHDVGPFHFNFYSLLLGTIALLLLLSKSFVRVERFLLTLVVLMSLAFISTALIADIQWSEFFAGLFTFQQPEGSFLTVIALIGTTVVPYNLFLHASLAAKKWKGEEGVVKSKRDVFIAMILGGLVSMAIVVSAAESGLQELLAPHQLADSLAPLYGNIAQYLLAFGLFAAGLTSAITAPLAAGFVAKGCFNLNEKQEKGVVIFVLLVGVTLSSLGLKSLELIQFAQIANAIVLPLIAVVLLWMMNNKALLGNQRNTNIQNILGALVVLFAFGMSLKSIYTLL
ncbi:NRAMP (natural resistance-associated macrophage protein) metal ion transporters [Lishizhenia tianjinensis]|uniref:NRAMP (Natural resistance-associated macrophage protein) metal ion transporters n=1 Tax=Lishizhenia tianjinensis TaxID=477690 RepID=A0A1I7B9M4_9FLAO|nr:divalent metal cation transporter [Lishizhenia tianjinensis]SFT83896.1 NRAMP (natural resistance-associated macrophage protein) metal ion transporters [Lishizhenia tianjinensis]